MRKGVLITALKPIENRNVVGVASYKYPLNNVCSHPECSIKRENRGGAHHIFPRSLITNDSYFVAITETKTNFVPNECIIPHVTWLCPDHHDDVEEHRAWIEWDEEQFIWHDREPTDETGYPMFSGLPGQDIAKNGWVRLGPLDPQPCTGEKHSKRRRRLKGDDRRKKSNVTIKVPKDASEDGAGLLYDAVEALEEALGHDPPRSMYYTIVDGLNLAIIHGLSND